MPSIYGALQLPESSRVALNTLSEEVIYDAFQQVLAQHNADLAFATSVFVERLTDKATIKYELPGGGYMQRRGRNSSAGAVKRTGKWSVGIPLEEFEDQIAMDRVTAAYATTEDLQMLVDNITIRNINTNRYEILSALFAKNGRSFDDELNPSLTVVGLANGDSVLYPPVVGKDTGATDDHYLVSGYAAASISDTNNPYPVMRTEIAEHFGGVAADGDNVVVLINEAQASLTQALADFKETEDRFIRSGANTDVPINLPAVPGTILGRVQGSAWVSQWNFVPAGYMVAVHLDAAKPLLRRKDPDYTGLNGDLALIARDENHPWSSSWLSQRTGYGVGNRLNGAIMQLKASGAFDIPSAYA